MANKAGRISGNPLCGLNERTCISVRKVLDGCITRYQDRSFSLSFEEPLSGDPPLSYIETRSSGPTTISDLAITPIEGNRNRVRFTSATPVTVTYTGSEGTTYTANSTVTIQRDIILNLPDNSLSNYTIEVSTSIVSTIGTIEDEVAEIRACVVQIVRVIASVDILVPSYGYCEYPPCEEYSDQVCRGLFNLPIFPTEPR